MEQKIILGVVGLLVVAAIGIYFVSPQGPSVTSDIPAGTYAELATCIKNSGAIFYGAWWCPHCQSQKKLFGDADKLLPYIECSTTDGKGQLPVCAAAGVTGYPTWIFPDNSKSTGEVPLATLAQKTSCTLPAGTTDTATTTGQASEASAQ